MMSSLFHVSLLVSTNFYISGCLAREDEEKSDDLEFAVSRGFTVL